MGRCGHPLELAHDTVVCVGHVSATARISDKGDDPVQDDVIESRGDDTQNDDQIQQPCQSQRQLARIPETLSLDTESHRVAPEVSDGRDFWTARGHFVSFCALPYAGERTRYLCWLSTAENRPNPSFLHRRFTEVRIINGFRNPCFEHGHGLFPATNFVKDRHFRQRSPRPIRQLMMVA
jgi:hypothetical protein